jgi:flagella basal body P-ring formation protein FlgA
MIPMKRFAFTSAFAFAFALAAGPPALADAQLRPDVVVDGDIVKLGDLFDNVGDRADTPVARAPAPGKRVTCDADWLLRIANMNHIVWRPQSVFDQAVVERSGVTVGHEQIESELLAALAVEGVPAKSEIELANRGARLVVPVGVPLRVGIRDLYYDSRYKHFSATVEVPAESPSAARLRVSGRVFPTVEVPTLARAVSHGEVIVASDITSSRVREDIVRRDVITDADQLIGMELRQNLRANQMISQSDLRKPLAVIKGALVTMILNYHGMTLTAQARAIDQGSLGDTIRLTNTQSNMTVEGRIEGTNLVAVTPGGGIAQAN